jgi:hypothetical protein
VSTEKPLEAVKIFLVGAEKPLEGVKKFWWAPKNL